MTENNWHKDMYNSEFARRTIAAGKFIELAKKQVDFLDSVLSLRPGAKVLDVPCGAGRHSVLFARRGYKVTGVDISQDCLKMARSDFSHRNVRYIQGDMARLEKFRDTSDLVLNLFTSFGYFHSDAKNEAVLMQMVKTLKPGGRLVLNLIDRDWIMKIYDPARWSEDQGILTLEASRYDPKSKYNESQMVIVDKRKKKPVVLHYHYHRVRLYSQPEILRLMKRAGLRDIRVFGDFDGNGYSRGKSTHPIYIGIRP